jgi:hypothetical protein
MLAASVPSFWTGLIAQRWLATEYGWFPVSGYGGPESSFLERVQFLILPSLVLGIVGILVFPVVCSTLAIIFGALALRDMGDDPGVSGRRMAWWGLGLGIAGLIIGLALIAYRFA